MESLANGSTYATIAKELGRTNSTVRVKAYRLRDNYIAKKIKKEIAKDILRGGVK